MNGVDTQRKPIEIDLNNFSVHVNVPGRNVKLTLSFNKGKSRHFYCALIAFVVHKMSEIGFANVGDGISIRENRDNFKIVKFLNRKVGPAGKSDLFHTISQAWASRLNDIENPMYFDIESENKGKDKSKYECSEAEQDFLGRLISTQSY